MDGLRQGTCAPAFHILESAITDGRGSPFISISISLVLKVVCRLSGIIKRSQCLRHTGSINYDRTVVRIRSLDLNALSFARSIAVQAMASAPSRMALSAESVMHCAVKSL